MKDHLTCSFIIYCFWFQEYFTNCYSYMSNMWSERAFGYYHIDKSMYTLIKVSNVYTSKTWKREKRGLIEYLPYFCRYIDCVYSLEPPRWWGLNEYLQSVIALIRKISNLIICKPLVLQRRDQRGFRSTCASALSDQTICWSHGVIVAYWRLFVWIEVLTDASYLH